MPTYLKDGNGNKIDPFVSSEAVLFPNGNLKNEIQKLNINIQNVNSKIVNSDFECTDPSSPSYIKNKPTSLPANGGNADTLGGKLASEYSTIEQLNAHNTNVDAHSDLFIKKLDNTDGIITQNLLETQLSDKINDCDGKKHSHQNIDILNSVNAEFISKVQSSSDHSTNSSLHLPSGGTEEQILARDADGTAKWRDEQSFSGDYNDLNNKPTLGSAASYDVKDNLTTTTDGGVLDAKQGKILLDDIITLRNDKVDKVSGQGLSSNDYTTLEKNKLSSIEEGANNYTHPLTHSANMITGLPTSLPANGGDADTVNGHTVDSDIPANAKFTDTTYSDMKGATSSSAGTHGLVPAPASGKQEQFLRGDGTWADIPVNSYTHPATHPATMITEDADHRFTTDGEKAGWNKGTNVDFGHTYPASALHNSVFFITNNFSTILRVKELKYTDSDGTEYIYQLSNEFVIQGASLTFVDNKCQITESRVTVNSLVDVYFTADSYSAAADAGVTVDSGDGFIDFACTTAPTGSLSADILVKVI